MQTREYLKLKNGYRTALVDGTLVPDSPQHMATEGLYHAVNGSRLHIIQEGYSFAVAIYSLERKPEYIYTYAYQKEQNWTTYTQNLTPQSYRTEDYIFDCECYFRVCVRRADGAELTGDDADKAGVMLEYYHDEPAYETKPWFQEEIAKTIGDIKTQATEGSMKLCLLTDTHYTVNGTWQDTAENIRKVSEQIEFDAIIHLGDLTDGMVSKELTKQYVQGVIGDLEKCQVPLYITLGNHDSNYFRNKENTFTKEEIQELYRLPGEEPDYYVDLPEHGVRMIFLSSFEDKAPIRYGYTKEQLVWLRKALFGAVKGTKFLIFSHDAPLAKLDYWSFLIRNGEALLDVLEECNQSDNYQIIGLFYGHTHADYVFEECSFPVVSIGCAKLEEFYDKKPEGAVTWSRKAADVTQDLWDSLIIDFAKQQLSFIRFGAGEDRIISFVKKKSTYKEVVADKRRSRKTKVWAHRGACAHAPENTLPAFRLARELGADGIELDVQLTKDDVMVVIHDETVDRVSDGSGWVKDYTYAELKELNAGKHFPAYGKVAIPTLAEVYEWVKDTDLLINLELKNSVVFYEDLEEKVLTLAEEYELEDRIIYSSFNHYSMRKIKALNADARVAFLYSNGILDMDEYAEKYYACAVHPSLKNMEYPESYDLVERCHAKGVKVHVWTVNEEVDFQRMRSLGVDAVITNYVERG